MSHEAVAAVTALIELGMIAQEDIVKCLKKALSEPEPQRKPLTDEQADKILETAEKMNPNYIGWVRDQRRAYVRAGYNAAHGIKENT